jgi:hypothetical protein
MKGGLFIFYVVLDRLDTLVPHLKGRNNVKQTEEEMPVVPNVSSVP